MDECIKKLFLCFLVGNYFAQGYILYKKNQNHENNYYGHYLKNPN